MGQYYNPIILGKNKKSIKGYFYSYNYGNGRKLMEHSYLLNTFVNAVMTYLNQVGGANIVWAGDYADKERATLKISKEEAMPIWQKKVSEGTTTCSFGEFYASNDESLYEPTNERAANLYGLCSRSVNGDGKVLHAGRPEINVSSEDIKKDFRFIVNETKKEFVDLYGVKSLGGYEVHPLPLLTCEGNGRGGGDYDGTSMSLIGSWARDFIVVPTATSYSYWQSLLKGGYKSINPLFAEIENINSSFNLVVEAFANIQEGGNLSDGTIKKIKENIKALREILKKEKEKTAA